MRLGSILFAFLVVMNLVLQLFDGVATYVGWEQFGEMNPLLLAGFARFGAGPTLLAAKLAAVAFVLFLAHAGARKVTVAGLTLTMTAYVAFSLIPWSLRLLV